LLVLAGYSFHSKRQARRFDLAQCGTREFIEDSTQKGRPRPLLPKAFNFEGTGCSKESERPNMLEFLDRLLPRFLLVTGCLFLAERPTLAADVNQGKDIAKRWCAGCHLVEHEQKSAPTDQAPPFASIATKTDFGASKLALLLLEPHPNMPKLELSRSEIADLAEYILTLKRPSPTSQ
jgi:mono/diheme cytochrome c family protein